MTPLEKIATAYDKTHTQPTTPPAGPPQSQGPARQNDPNLYPPPSPVEKIAKGHNPPNART